MLKRFKNRRPIVYIFFVFYMLLSVLILVESCLNSSISGDQSGLFAKISAFFINLFNGPQTVTVIKPTELLSVKDSSFAKPGDDNVPNIVIGTTTMLNFEVKYPSKKKKDDTYDLTKTYTKNLGNGDDYNIVVANPTMKDGNCTYTIRIVANEMTSGLYSIDCKFGGTVDYTYQFHIVELAKPADDQFVAKLEKDSLNINETIKIDTKFVDLGPNHRDDIYIRRYLDEPKIYRSSSNEAVATIDENGVIHALSEGTTTISYGGTSESPKYEFPIIVSSTVNALPISLDVNIDASGNANPCLLDYDYMFTNSYTTGEPYNPDEYSVVVKANISDASVSWKFDNEMYAKIAPYSYDVDGYPLYQDNDGNPAVRIAGYRKKGDINLICASNSNPALSQTIPLTVGEAVASEITISLTGNVEVNVNEQVSVSIKTYAPENLFNKAIHVTVSDETVVEIKNNDTESVSLKALKLGTVHVTVKSLSNESLIKEFDITTKAKQVINDDNFSDFHSIVRKFAGHFMLFLITAVFGFVFFYNFYEEKKEKLKFGLPLLLGSGLLVAGLSELIQYFVPTRSGLWRDVGIDYLGFVAGVIICVLVVLLITWIKSLMNKKKAE